MATGTETTAADAYIRSALLADAELAGLVGTRVFLDMAPVGTQSPFVVYSLQNSSDVGAVGGRGVVLSRLFYTVKGVCEGASYTPILAVANRIQAVLHKPHNVVVDGWLIQGIQRQKTLQYPERFDDTSFRHLGGEYRVFVNESEAGDMGEGNTWAERFLREGD